MRRGLVGALGLILLMSCGGDSVSPTNPNNVSLAGTYTLRTINSSGLPYAIQSSGTTVQITGDQVTVADGGSFSETTSYKVVATGASQVGSSTGTWARAGSTITFTFLTGGSGVITGSGDGTNLTLVLGALGTWVYTK